MPRVLHLLSLAADAQTRRVQATLADRLGTEFPGDTRTLGPGGDHRHAAGAAAAVRQSDADVVVAWGTPALLAAAMAGRQRPVLFAPDHYLGPKPLRWVRTLLDWAGGHMVCPTDAQRRAAVTRGVPDDRCHVVRPGVDFGRVRQAVANRQQLRAELGLTDDDRVLVAPGESSWAAGHERAVWTCGILHILDPRYKIVIQGRGVRAAAAVHLAGKLKQAGMMVNAEARLRRPIPADDLVAVADAAVLAPTGVVPTLPILSAMAAGVPCVSVVTYATSELLEDRHTALMVGTDAPKPFGRRIMDVAADPALAAQVADAARAEAYELHTQSRMVDRYRRVLRQLAQRRAVDPEAD